MSRKRRRRTGTVLALALALQWAWALPVAVAASISAIDCCERHCEQHPWSPDACCEVAPALAEGSSLRAPQVMVPPIVLATPIAPIAEAIAATGTALSRVPQSNGAPAPPWLRLLTLLL